MSTEAVCNSPCTTETEEEIKEKQDILNKLINCKLPGWDQVKTLKDVSIYRASGAMTNIIYRCSNLINEDAYSPVLLRIYGVGSELFFDRKREIELFTVLSNNAFGIKLITKMKEGRVEEWKEGFQAITNPVGLMDDTMIKVAKKMSEMHHIEVPRANRDSIFNRIGKWIENIHTVYGQDTRGINLDNLDKEFKSLHALFDKDEFPIVFAHCDLQHGNILENENKDLMFVDFEYSTSCSAAYDIANYFSEMMYDYNESDSEFPRYNNFPKEERAKWFIGLYLENYLERKPTQEEIDSLYKLVLKHTCICTFHWMVWGILQTPLSTIEWGYYPYLIEKFKFYKQIKPLYYGEESLDIISLDH